MSARAPFKRALRLGVALVTLAIFTAGCGKPCEDWGLYTVRPDGTDRHRVKLDESRAKSDFSGFVGYATWLPGGSRIAFKDGCGWWTVNADGSDLQWPPSSPVFDSAGVRLRWILSKEPPTDVGGFKIPPPVLGFEIHRRGGSTMRVLYHWGSDYSGDISCSAPVTIPDPEIAPRLSPDARFVAYVDDVDMRPNEKNYELFVVPTAGGKPRRLTWSHDRDEMAPTWSPDGRRIAFVEEWLRGDVWFYDVVVVNDDGTGRRVISRTGTTAAWASDGKSLAVLADGGLIVVDITGAVIQRLATGDGLFPYSVSWGPAEKVAYVQDTGDSSQDKCGS
jgi:hypothetical protein